MLFRSNETRSLRERERVLKAQLDIEQDLLGRVGEHLGCDRDGRESATYFGGILHVIDTEWSHESSAPREEAGSCRGKFDGLSICPGYTTQSYCVVAGETLRERSEEACSCRGTKYDVNGTCADCGHVHLFDEKSSLLGATAELKADYTPLVLAARLDCSHCQGEGTIPGFERRLLCRCVTPMPVKVGTGKEEERKDHE